MTGRAVDGLRCGVTWGCGQSRPFKRVNIMDTPNIRQLGPDGATFSDSLSDYYARLLNRLRQLRPAIRAALLAATVRRVEATYDSVGDSGQIESLNCFGSAGEAITPELSPECDLAAFFYDLLEARYAGYENDEGAFGDFSWDLIEDTLHQVHNERFTEVHCTETEGL